MVDMAHIAGLAVSGHHPSPVPYADVITQLHISRFVAHVGELFLQIAKI